MQLALLCLAENVGAVEPWSVQLVQVKLCAGAEKGVQGSRYTGVQVIKVQSLYFPMESCRGIKKCSRYAGVQVIQVFMFTGSTVFLFKFLCTSYSNICTSF